MGGVSVQFDEALVLANLTRMAKAADGNALSSNLAVGGEILRLGSVGPPPQVPHDKGTLQGSGAAVPEGDNGDVVVGYNTVYAARLHEHPEYHFQKGRKAKYLEDPIKNNLEALGLIWGGNMKNKIMPGG